MLEPVAHLTILMIELREIEPRLWRRVDEPLSSALLALHDIIQVAFLSTNSHLCEFVVGEHVYGEPMPDDDVFERVATQDLFFWIVLLAQIWHKSCVGATSSDDKRIGRLRDEVGRLREELSRRERENEGAPASSVREIEHLRLLAAARPGFRQAAPFAKDRPQGRPVPVDGLVRSMAGRRAARARHGLTGSTTLVAPSELRASRVRPRGYPAPGTELHATE